MSFSQDLFTKLATEQGHSPAFIEASIAYALHLEEKGLPVIFTTPHLGQILNTPDLKRIIYNRAGYYKYYQIQKKRGGVRQIVTPYSNLKAIQRFIHNEILSKVPIHPCVHGFVQQQSILDNARPHANSQAILNLDLLKFFDSIPERRVYGIFKGLGYSKSLARALAQLTTVALPEEYLQSFTKKERTAYQRIIPSGTPVLPQGAPTSPVLSNLVLYRTDLRLAALAQKQGVMYSRYADDLTFSGPLVQLPKIKLVAHIIKEEGFNINWNKVNIYQRGKKQLVTGLTVSNEVHVPQAYKKEIRKHIYGCSKFGVQGHTAFMKIDKGFYKEWLLGKINFVNAIEPQTGHQLLELFNKIVWPI